MIAYKVGHGRVPCIHFNTSEKSRRGEKLGVSVVDLLERDKPVCPAAKGAPTVS